MALDSKKNIIIYVHEILKKYSDEQHKLSQKDIEIILQSDYSIKVDRKAIKRNLDSLIECGCHIECTEKKRKNKSGEDDVLCTDWYLERDFTTAELTLIIDSLLFSREVPSNHCYDLIRKLEGLSSKYFVTSHRHIKRLPLNKSENKQLLYSIDIINDAIKDKKQVSFIYNTYDIDKKLHPRLKDGKLREYIINPYQIVASNGRFYLVCNNDKYDNISNYRLDKITDIKILSSAQKPIDSVNAGKHCLDIPKHMAEHIYMFSGESGRVTFRAKRCIINDIIDWFGLDINFSDETEDEVTASVIVNLEAMRCWALQYARHIKLLSPQSLVEIVKADLLEAVEKYQTIYV